MLYTIHYARMGLDNVERGPYTRTLEAGNSWEAEHKFYATDPDPARTWIDYTEPAQPDGGESDRPEPSK